MDTDSRVVSFLRSQNIFETHPNISIFFFWAIPIIEMNKKFIHQVSSRCQNRSAFLFFTRTALCLRRKITSPIAMARCFGVLYDFNVRLHPGAAAVHGRANLVCLTGEAPPGSGFVQIFN